MANRQTKKRGSPLGNPPRFLPEKAYFAASTVSAAASVAVESACSQAAVESHFSVQASQAEASVAAASVAASSAAAFLLAFPPQLTIATAARTMTKEKIFFIASNVLNMNFLNAAKIDIRKLNAKKNEEFSRTAANYSRRSAAEITSFLRKALGKVCATLPLRMMASSVVRQFPTETENHGLS